MPERTNDKNIFSETLEWICDKLEKADIPYMITGGSAVGFWGHIRTTMDIDIVIQTHLDKLDKLLAGVKDAEYIDIDKAGQLYTGKKMFNIIYNKTCFKIDIILLKRTPYEIESFNNRIRIKLGSRDIFVIKPENLIISKLLWSKSSGESEKQIKDCESIYKLNSENLNFHYLQKWVNKLGIEDEFKKKAI